MIVAPRTLYVLHGSDGFSLLEVMLAILLLALLLAGAYSGITSARHSMRSGEAIIERVDKVRTVQEFLRHQISRILPFPYAQDGTKVEVFQGDGKFMRFVAPMPGYLSRGGAYVQTLALTPGDDGLQLVFTSTLLNGFGKGKNGPDDGSTVVLLDHIEDGTFRYRGLDPQGELMNWGENWQDSGTTPLLVRLDLQLANGARVPWPQMTIPLMMDVGARRAGPMGLAR
ncbi:MAG: prepilin-type N-terminal cleavage/methylation domain-containing protein [Rudaea sp.]|uniref:prepilin-type N-terminal cleavage/methylation domain-containing protein n=1 Tax=Rudaea sp. TaxID=2136325 RepID=UPI0039E389AF